MMKLVFSILSVCCALAGLCLMAWSLMNGATMADGLFSGFVPLALSGVLSQAN